MTAGEWRRAEIGYLKAVRTHCDLCGQPVPGRYWVSEVDGCELVFCGPEHAEKFVSYWIPRYGTERTAARPLAATEGRRVES